MLIFVASVAQAKVKSLCAPTEQIIWAGQTHGKIYSICASKDLTHTKGYLQYRVGTLGAVEFKYPANLGPPDKHFEYAPSAHGAWFQFKNDGYTYSISEPLIGEAIIDVEKDGETVSRFRVHDSTHSLSDNSTIDLFKLIGIYE